MNPRPVSRLAGLLLAIPFFQGGWGYRLQQERRTALAASLGFPYPRHAARFDAAVKLVGGAALALGWHPRVAAAVLALNLIPTTVAAHPFWRQPEPGLRARQRQAAILNLGVLGGLVSCASRTA